MLSYKGRWHLPAPRRKRQKGNGTTMTLKELAHNLTIIAESDGTLAETEVFASIVDDDGFGISRRITEVGYLKTFDGQRLIMLGNDNEDVDIPLIKKEKLVERPKLLVVNITCDDTYEVLDETEGEKLIDKLCAESYEKGCPYTPDDFAIMWEDEYQEWLDGTEETE